MNRNFFATDLFILRGINVSNQMEAPVKGAQKFTVFIGMAELEGEHHSCSGPLLTVILKPVV